MFCALCNSIQLDRWKKRAYAKFLLLSRISDIIFVFLSAMEFEARGMEVVTVEAMRSLSMIVEVIRELVRLIGCGNWARRSISFKIDSVALITVDGDFERLPLIRDLLDGEDLLLQLE